MSRYRYESKIERHFERSFELANRVKPFFFSVVPSPKREYISGHSEWIYETGRDRELLQTLVVGAIVRLRMRLRVIIVYARCDVSFGFDAYRITCRANHTADLHFKKCGRHCTGSPACWYQQQISRIFLRGWIK